MNSFEAPALLYTKPFGRTRTAVPPFLPTSRAKSTQLCGIDAWGRSGRRTDARCGSSTRRRHSPIDRGDSSRLGSNGYTRANWIQSVDAGLRYRESFAGNRGAGAYRTPRRGGAGTDPACSLPGQQHAGRPSCAGSGDKPGYVCRRHDYCSSRAGAARWKSHFRPVRVDSCRTRKHCNIRELVHKGEAAQEIIALASEMSCDLLMIGAEHRRFFDTSVLGATTVRTVRHAPCPALTVVGPRQ